MNGLAPAAAWSAIAFDAALAVFHALFWRLFGWPETLAPAGRVNTAISQTLNLMLTYVLFAYALALAWQLALAGSLPGPLLAAGAGFWVLRCILQPLLFSISRSINAGLTALWLLGATIHAVAI